MKIVPILIFFVGWSLHAGEFKHLNLNQVNDIVVIEESYNMYNSKGKIARFYQEMQKGDLHHLFNLILNDKTGSCTASTLEKGSYEVNGTILTLYTKWERQGSIHDAPYGFRRIVYHMEDNGTLSSPRGKIYVETARKSHKKKSGMYFLFTPPKSLQEKQALAAYIENVQRRFRGTFVQGKEKERLKTEVEAALKRKMNKRWQ